MKKQSISKVEQLNNLKQQVIDLKVANKDKAETIKSMKQELLEYNQLRDRFKVLYEENQELRDKLNSEALDNWQLHCKYGKYKKALEILKDKMPIQFLGYNKYGAKPYEIIFNGFVIGLDQQEYEFLKEELGDEH